MSKETVQRSIYDSMLRLGVNETQTDLYLKLLELGPSTITELSNKSKFPRTTVHANVERLIQKGLITQSIINNRRKIIAENPNRIQTIVMDKKVELETDLSEISQLTSELPDFVNSILNSIPHASDNSNVVVKYFEGTQGFLDVHQRTLDSNSKELLFISDMDEWKKVFKDDFAYAFYVPERIKRQIFAKTLAIDSPLSREIRSNDNKYYREMRFLPKGFSFKPTIIISDDEISIMTSTKPYTATLIHNKSIAVMFKEIFNFMWSISR